MGKIIKEIIIMLLVCLATMLALAIALYQYIPNRKIVPEIKQYVASTEIQDLLEDDIDTKSDKDNVILTYEVTSNDLAGYQKNYEYVPGKSNPFKPAAPTVEGEPEPANTSDDEEKTTEVKEAENKEEQKAPTYQTETTK